VLLRWDGFEVGNSGIFELWKENEASQGVNDCDDHRFVLLSFSPAEKSRKMRTVREVGSRRVTCELHPDLEVPG